MAVRFVVAAAIVAGASCATPLPILAGAASEARPADKYSVCAGWCEEIETRCKGRGDSQGLAIAFPSSAAAPQRCQVDYVDCERRCRHDYPRTEPVPPPAS